MGQQLLRWQAVSPMCCKHIQTFSFIVTLHCSEFASGGQLNAGLLSIATLPIVFLANSPVRRPKGLPYMTSALEGGGGLPNSRQKERGCVNSVPDKGGAGQNIRSFCRHHIWKPPKFLFTLVCRLERAVHDKVRLLRLPDRGRRPMGGGPQQQLPQPVLQLHGEFGKEMGSVTV